MISCQQMDVYRAPIGKEDVYKRQEQFDDFVRFCKKNKVSIGIVVLMTFLTYGFMLFNFSFSIDTEDIVVRQLDFYDGWIGINRYGLVFTKWIFGVLNIVPGYASILMVLSTIGYGIIWMYFFYWIGGRTRIT